MKLPLNLRWLGAMISAVATQFEPVMVARAAEATNPPPTVVKKPMTEKVTKTEAEWQKILDPEQFQVLRKKDTERAFTGKYWDTTTAGIYRCAGCGQVLFVSDTKFDSGCGWPSFFAPDSTNAVTTSKDTTLGMVRTEVVCSKCGGHLGHVFDDGPNPTGLRYCINSASLKFEEKPKDKTPEKK